MKEAKATINNGLASGLWRFDLPIDDVIKIACRLRQEDWPDGHFAEMSVRGCGKNSRTGEHQHGIQFRYNYSATEKEYAIFFHSLKRKLMKMSGGELSGWDICSSTVLIEL